MAITVTDQRAILNECDSTTGWTGASGTATSEPTPIESTACITDILSNTTNRAYYTDGTGWDMSAGCFYVWFTHRAALATTANGGIRVVIGDGTNRIEYYIAGEDKAGFRHDTGPAAWQCFIIDSENPPTSFNTLAGSEASLDWSSIVDIGIGGTTLAKAVGGAVNFFTDIIRFGDTGEGLAISGGTSGTPGILAELATADRSIGNQQAYGIFRELSSDVYGCQGPLTFGASAVADGYLEGNNEVIVFEARNLLDDKYSLTVAGDTTYVTSFVLNSCIVKSAAHGVTCDFTDANIDTLTFDACTFADLKNAISFTNTAAASGHSVTGTVFSGCGQIDPGDVTFTGNNIANTTDATGGLLLDEDGTGNFSDLTFISDGTGHAIYIRPTGAGPFTFNLSGMSFSGYGLDTTTDAELYIHPITVSANITINITNGVTPTFREDAGYTGTLTINNNKSITFTGMKDNTEVRIYKTSDDTEVDGIENATAGTTDNRTFTWSAAASLSVYYVLHNWNAVEPFYQTIRVEDYIVPSSDTSIAIQQQLDRNAA